MYSPLNFKTFSGTYISWDVDWITFKKSTEPRYMHSSGSAGDDSVDSELRRKVQRLAVRHTNINGHLRLASDPDNEAARWPGQVYIYPSLKMMAVVEVLASVSKRTENLSIRPKRNVPDKLPDNYCPTKQLRRLKLGLPYGIAFTRRLYGECCSVGRTSYVRKCRSWHELRPFSQSRLASSWGLRS